MFKSISCIAFISLNWIWCESKYFIYFMFKSISCIVFISLNWIWCESKYFIYLIIMLSKLHCMWQWGELQMLEEEMRRKNVSWCVQEINYDMTKESKESLWSNNYKDYYTTKRYKNNLFWLRHYHRKWHLLGLTARSSWKKSIP